MSDERSRSAEPALNPPAPPSTNPPTQAAAEPSNNPTNNPAAEEEGNDTPTVTTSTSRTFNYLPYADINKYPLFYGNPDKNDKYLSTAQAKQQAKHWMFQLENIFNLNQIPETQRTPLAIIKFQGAALSWIMHEESEGNDLRTLSWSNFKKQYNIQFCYVTEDSDRSVEYELLTLKLKKDMPIAEYHEKFIRLRNQLKGHISESFLLGVYIHNLPYFMRKELDIMKIDKFDEVKQAAEGIANRNSELLKNDSTFEDDFELNFLNYAKNNGFKKSNGNFKNKNGYKTFNNFRRNNNGYRRRNGYRRFNNNRYTQGSGYGYNTNYNNNNNNSERTWKSRNYFRRTNPSPRGNPNAKDADKNKKEEEFSTLEVEGRKKKNGLYNEWNNPYYQYNALYNKSNNNSTASYYSLYDNNNNRNYKNKSTEIQLGTLYLPNTEQLGLASTLVGGVHQSFSLLDTGATADVISINLCQQFQMEDEVFYYDEPRYAKAVEGQVSIIGYIRVHLKVAISKGVITETRSLYVIDAVRNTILLGLPFIKQWKEQILIEDFFVKDINKKTKPNILLNPNIKLSMFDFEEKYVNTLLTDKTNDYYLCYVNEIDTVNKDENHSNMDIEINEPKVNYLRDSILEEYRDVVTNESPAKLPPNRGKNHRIMLIEPKRIVSRKQYPLSYQEKLELTTQVEELLQKGFIQESQSPYNSPILFVKKKDNTLRMCVDYRLLNNNTVKDKFPLPKIEIITSQLGKANIYSKLDLMSGYYQVRVAEEDIEKTAFSTEYGHYEWVVMPFGLTNAPATFQRLMNQLLHPYIGKFVQVYLDDIFIYSANEDEHYEHIKLVLNCLRQNNWIAKLKKCAFFFRELKFLGMIITPQGIKTDPEKIIKIQEWPVPKNIKEAQSFIGLATYYRRFVKNFSKIAAPIHEFIAKKSEWSILQQQAFNELKKRLITTPVLVHPIWDPHYCFLVHTDACGTALGFTLEQVQPSGKSRGVIAYGSTKLKPSQQRYSIYDREFLAVIEALKTWKYYLYNRHFIIRTDHQSLVYLKNQNLIDSTRVAKWLDFLCNYDFEIQYIKGKNNSAADALSRYPSLDTIEMLQEDLNQQLDMHINTIQITTLSQMIPNLNFKEEISKGYKYDYDYAEIYDILKNKKQIPDKINNHIKHYKCTDDLLYYTTSIDNPQYRLLIPDYKNLINRVINNAHSGLDAGHFGYWKTYLNLSDTFYWKRMVHTVKRFCNKCITCQRHNTTTQKLQGLFNPLPIPEGRWTDVTMDFITGLPVTDIGNDMIMVIIDRMTKMAHFIPTQKTMTAEQCARLFIDFCFKHHGVPRRLVTDKDIRFTNKFWQTIHFLLGTSLLFSTTNHPQTDGETERMNKTLIAMIRKYCTTNLTRWDQYLAPLEFAYNSTYQDSIKNTPFKLALGYNPESFKHLNINNNDEQFSAPAKEYYQKMNNILQNSQDNLVEAQRKQEIYHNRKRRQHDYQVGDLILLNREAFGYNTNYFKIQPVYHGPFKLVKQINNNAFEVDLPVTNNKDRIMNVQWFKPYQEPAYISRRVPITNAEIKARINDITTIAGYDRKERTYDVYWKDSNPAHATTITEAQFQLASPLLRKSLLFNARMIKDLPTTTIK